MLYSKKLNLAGRNCLVRMFDCIPNPLGDHRFVYVIISSCGTSIFLFFLIGFVLLRYILKAIKNATGTSVIFPINISLIHFVFVYTSAPNVGERFTKTRAQLHTSVKNFSEK